ncbi:thioredoxin-dependent thiol peroxidase [Zhihengliuella alba]|uniref:thioredoxin-dependent peroxiredoxin n=1 Tax=Zhihengliuella alba TaxID=547018 RepID=A0ABP7DNW8_9MICC
MSDQQHRLSPGDQAPNFELPTARGGTASLTDFAGRSVVVYFYPKAATPGCTTEACDFRDSLSALQGAGYDVVGISPDPIDDIEAFAADEALTFPLLSDESAEVAKAYGAYGEKEFNGQRSTGVLRTTVVVGPDGRVQHAEYNVAAQGHVSRLRDLLGV